MSLLNGVLCHWQAQRWFMVHGAPLHSWWCIDVRPMHRIAMDASSNYHSSLQWEFHISTWSSVQTFVGNIYFDQKDCHLYKQNNIKKIKIKNNERKTIKENDEDVRCYGDGNTTMAIERLKDMKEKDDLQPMRYERTIQNLVTWYADK